MGPRRKADLDFLIAAQGHRRTRPFGRALAGFTLARRQNFTAHMTAGGALIRDQPRFASKRSDADDLLHPLLAPGTWNAISPLEKVRHRITSSRNAHYSRKTRVRLKRFPLRSAIFALHHCDAHPALPGQAPVRRRDHACYGHCFRDRNRGPYSSLMVSANLSVKRAAGLLSLNFRNSPGEQELEGFFRDF
jgi:hypothetical protein